MLARRLVIRKLRIRNCVQLSQRAEEIRSCRLIGARRAERGGEVFSCCVVPPVAHHFSAERPKYLRARLSPDGAMLEERSRGLQIHLPFGVLGDAQRVDVRRIAGQRLQIFALYVGECACDFPKLLESLLRLFLVADPEPLPQRAQRQDKTEDANNFGRVAVPGLFIRCGPGRLGTGRLSDRALVLGKPDWILVRGHGLTTRPLTGPAKVAQKQSAPSGSA